MGIEIRGRKGTVRTGIEPQGGKVLQVGLFLSQVNREKYLRKEDWRGGRRKRSHEEKKSVREAKRMLKNRKLRIRSQA